MLFDELFEFLKHGFFHVGKLGAKRALNKLPASLGFFRYLFRSQHLPTGCENGKSAKPFRGVNSATRSQIDKVGMWCAFLSATRTQYKLGADVAILTGFPYTDRFFQKPASTSPRFAFHIVHNRTGGTAIHALKIFVRRTQFSQTFQFDFEILEPFKLNRDQLTHRCRVFRPRWSTPRRVQFQRTNGCHTRHRQM